MGSIRPTITYIGKVSDGIWVELVLHMDKELHLSSKPSFDQTLQISDLKSFPISFSQTADNVKLHFQRSSQKAKPKRLVYAL